MAGNKRVNVTLVSVENINGIRVKLLEHAEVCIGKFGETILDDALVVWKPRSYAWPSRG